MKILIIGGMTAGAKVAAKLRRELGKGCDIEVLCKSDYVSYAPWCLPQYLSNSVLENQPMAEHTPESISALVDVNFRTGVEAIGLNRNSKTVSTRNLSNGTVQEYLYDRLVIATGADYDRPEFVSPDLEGFFFLRNLRDAEQIKAAVDSVPVKRAVVFGGNKTAIEIACSLNALGVRVSIICNSQLLDEFDRDYADYLENELANSGIPVFAGENILSVEGEQRIEKIVCSKRSFKTDMLVWSDGLVPNTKWLEGSGIGLTDNGLIAVDGFFKTSDPDIYSCGDCIEVTDLITGEKVWNPAGSSATIEGRFLAKSVAGSATKPFKGTLRTVIFHTPSANVGMTGLSYEYALAKGFDAVCTTIGTDDKDKRIKGSSPFLLRLIADRGSGRVLGCEVIGKGNVDKMIDTAVAVISLGGTLGDVEDMDFAFAPEFSTPVQPFEIAAHTLQNKIDGKLFGDSYEYLDLDDSWVVLDSSRLQAIPQIRHISVSSINGELSGIPFDSKIALLCPGGRFSNVASNRLRRYGYTKVCSIEGGTIFNFKLIEDFSKF